MVLVEAQACGRPVLAGRSGGTAETLVEGETGITADCTTPGNVAKSVAGLLSDVNRLESMGKAGREWVVRRFDWDALVVQAQQVFEGSM
jgi:phosphatidylinositol alpha-1,6-mannosyltransferase